MSVESESVYTLLEMYSSSFRHTCKAHLTPGIESLMLTSQTTFHPRSSREQEPIARLDMKIPAVARRRRRIEIADLIFHHLHQTVLSRYQTSRGTQSILHPPLFINRLVHAIQRHSWLSNGVAADYRKFLPVYVVPYTFYPNCFFAAFSRYAAGASARHFY